MSLDNNNNNNNNNNKICIHNYLKKCETGSLPPGLTDFLRGTIALYDFSKKYNYKLYINKTSNPVFKYFENCEYYINDTDSIKGTFELLSQAKIEFTTHILEKLFQNGFDFSVITNCLLKDIFVEGIDDDCREFIVKILQPTKIINDKLEYVFNILKINGDYNAIHIRFGDIFLCQNELDYNILNKIDNIIKSIIEKSDKPVILVTDSGLMSKELLKINNEIRYWDNKKIHIGFLFNYDEEAIVDTLVDFFILSKSKTIHTININSVYFTTFSPLIAKIYNITNIRYQLINT
jgi:hypothetical protein